MSLHDMKRREIYQALVAHGGNKTKAAQALGISIRGLRNVCRDDPMFAEFRNDPPEGSIMPAPQARTVSQEVAVSREIQQREDRMAEVFDTREVVSTLNRLMNKVTEEKTTAETVNAACNCASQITQLLRVHLDVERLRRSVGR